MQNIIENPTKNRLTGKRQQDNREQETYLQKQNTKKREDKNAQKNIYKQGGNNTDESDQSLSYDPLICQEPEIINLLAKYNTSLLELFPKMDKPLQFQDSFEITPMQLLGLFPKLMNNKTHDACMNEITSIIILALDKETKATMRNVVFEQFYQIIQDAQHCFTKSRWNQVIKILNYSICTSQNFIDNLSTLTSIVKTIEELKKIGYIPSDNDILLILKPSHKKKAPDIGDFNETKENAPKIISYDLDDTKENAQKILSWIAKNTAIVRLFQEHNIDLYELYYKGQARKKEALPATFQLCYKLMLAAEKVIIKQKKISNPSEQAKLNTYERMDLHAKILTALIPPKTLQSLQTQEQHSAKMQDELVNINSLIQDKLKERNGVEKLLECINDQSTLLHDNETQSILTSINALYPTNLTYNNFNNNDMLVLGDGDSDNDF